MTRSFININQITRLPGLFLQKKAHQKAAVGMFWGVNICANFKTKSYVQ